MDPSPARSAWPRTLVAALAVVVAASPARLAAADGLQALERAYREEMDSDIRLAVKRGLRYLVSVQSRTGAFSERFPVAVNALAGLAFLAAGYNGQVGPYTGSFDRCVTHLLSLQQTSGYFTDGQSRMYGHGFATLFIAELYGMDDQRDATLRDALVRAVRLIERSQSPDGGWDYEPIPASGSGDTSITVCQTMALRAARNLGIAVDPVVIGRAKGFILKAQSSDGGFYYRLNLGLMHQTSAFPRSAAGVCVLLSLGEYNTTAVERGFRYLLENHRSRSVFPFYADYYCTQAMFQAGRHYWRDYFRYVRSKLLSRQLENGSWKGGFGGPEQSTAMALIALQVPLRYLPIVER